PSRPSRRRRRAGARDGPGGRRRARARARQPRAERAPPWTGGREGGRRRRAGGRRRAAQRHRRGRRVACRGGEARVSALLASQPGPAWLGARARDRARDRRTARRPRLRRRVAVHDRIAGSQEPFKLRRYNRCRRTGERIAVKLFPSGALTGAAGSALLSGATGRLWATNDGRGRLELQSGAGDAQIVWNADKVTAYDASSNTVYSFTLPQHSSPATPDTGTPPALSEITSFLS